MIVVKSVFFQSIVECDEFKNNCTNEARSCYLFCASKRFVVVSPSAQKFWVSAFLLKVVRQFFRLMRFNQLFNMSNVLVRPATFLIQPNLSECGHRLISNHISLIGPPHAFREEDQQDDQRHTL